MVKRTPRGDFPFSLSLTLHTLSRLGPGVFKKEKAAAFVVCFFIDRTWNLFPPSLVCFHSNAIRYFHLQQFLRGMMLGGGKTIHVLRWDETKSFWRFASFDTQVDVDHSREKPIIARLGVAR